MVFVDRQDAGRKLAECLAPYHAQEVVVYGLPRGGVVVAAEIARFLDAPLECLFAHKIGHPRHAEYAIAAVSESGYLVGNEQELSQVSKEWLEKEKNLQMSIMRQRKFLYHQKTTRVAVENKVAIIVDDGIATGLTVQAGILEIKSYHPKSIVVAVPVTPQSVAQLLKKMGVEVISLIEEPEGQYRGAVGAYYRSFSQIEDEEVIALCNA